MNPRKMPWKVYKLVEEQGCNTSGDIADALEIPVARASEYVGDLIKAGVLRRTGQTIPNSRNSGQQYLVVEVAE